MSFSIINSPLQIGTRTFAHRLIQAPLAGISCSPFRALFAHFMLPAYAVTEMISANSLLQHQRLAPRYLHQALKEGPLAIQLSGNDPGLLYEATQIAATYRPALIDLNCGCPKTKIRSRGCGSALLEQPKLLGAIVASMRKATTLPLTVKIRTAGQTNDSHYLQAAKVIEANGADGIIVHGRHYTEGYDVNAQYTQICKVVEQVEIPVIANGDVATRSALEACLKTTGAAGFMIGRGSIGKPWLFQELLGGVQPFGINILKRVAYFSEHVAGVALLENSEQQALLQARRLLKWYFPTLTQNQLEMAYTKTSLSMLCDYLINQGDGIIEH